MIFKQTMLAFVPAVMFVCSLVRQADTKAARATPTDERGPSAPQGGGCAPGVGGKTASRAGGEVG